METQNPPKKPHGITDWNFKIPKKELKEAKGEKKKEDGGILKKENLRLRIPPKEQKIELDFDTVRNLKGKIDENDIDHRAKENFTDEDAPKIVVWTASLIDSLIMLVVITSSLLIDLVFLLGLREYMPLEAIFQWGLKILVGAGVYCLFVIVCYRFFGTTLGSRLTGLTLENHEGHDISFIALIVREIPGRLLGVVLGIGLILPLLFSRGVEDYLSGSYPKKL